MGSIKLGEGFLLALPMLRMVYFCGLMPLFYVLMCLLFYLHLK